MKYKVISLYKYIEINDPESLCNTIRSKCQDLNILGRILIGGEGINAAFSGKVEEVELFQLFLKQNSLFSDLTFREQLLENNSYHKLVVRIRDEVVSFGKEVDLENKGKHLEPSQLEKWYNEGEDFVIIDVRNDYEYELGHFKNAIKLPIKNFREFPEVINKVSEEIKNKKVVMYCTGGVRCEKASAYMKENGFEDVYQLQGGIINYVNQYPESNWGGGLFVFDDRLVSQQQNTLTKCKHCDNETQVIINCNNLDCDKLFICCESCQKGMKKTCSDECKNSSRKRKQVVKEEIIGKIENYYAKSKIALMKIEKGTINSNKKLIFRGKTTTFFEQTIFEMRSEDNTIIESASQGELITFLINKKVRKNDLVSIAV